MRVLFVNCGYGSKQCSLIRNTVRDTLVENGITEVDASLVTPTTVKEYVYEKETEINDPNALVKFDKLDLVFVYGPSSLKPWDEKLYYFKKIALGYEFGSNLICYTVATGGFPYKVEEVTSNRKLENAPPPKDLKFSLRVNVLTGEAFRYQTLPPGWVRFGNVGICTRIHKDREKVISTHIAAPTTLPCSKIDEVVGQVMTHAIQHPLCSTLPRNFIVSSLSRWRIRDEVMIEDKRWNPLVESARGHLVFEYENMAGFNLKPDAKYKETITLLVNFVQSRITTLRDKGNVALRSQKLLEQLPYHKRTVRAPLVCHSEATFSGGDGMASQTNALTLGAKLLAAHQEGGKDKGGAPSSGRSHYGKTPVPRIDLSQLHLTATQRTHRSIDDESPRTADTGYIDTTGLASQRLKGWSTSRQAAVYRAWTARSHESSSPRQPTERSTRLPFHTARGANPMSNSSSSTSYSRPRSVKQGSAVLTHSRYEVATVFPSQPPSPSQASPTHKISKSPISPRQPSSQSPTRQSPNRRKMKESAPAKVIRVFPGSELPRKPPRRSIASPVSPRPPGRVPGNTAVLSDTKLPPQPASKPSSRRQSRASTSSMASAISKTSRTSRIQPFASIVVDGQPYMSEEERRRKEYTEAKQNWVAPDDFKRHFAVTKPSPPRKVVQASGPYKDPPHRFRDEKPSKFLDRTGFKF